MKDLSRMKYLEQFIKEVLRHYPSVPFIGRKLGSDTRLGKALLRYNNYFKNNVFYNKIYFRNMWSLNEMRECQLSGWLGEDLAL